MKQALFKKLISIGFLVFLSLVIIGCTTQESEIDKETKAAQDRLEIYEQGRPAGLIKPNSEYDWKEYEIETHSDGEEMETHVYEEDYYDADSVFEQKRRLFEEQDKANTLKDVWAKKRIAASEGRYWDEEKRIERYCEEHGWLRCSKITETCFNDGCREVKINCDDDKFDASLLSWDEYEPRNECSDYEVEIVE